MSFTYKGLEATLSRHITTDEEVERHIQRLLQQNPVVTPVTGRPAQQGDQVVLDYAGYCDGVQFEGGTAQGQTLTLGSGMFIPGFEDQLVGANAGQEVTVNVTFPAQYHSQELAGKDAQFICTVHEIREQAPAEADDRFAQQVGGCENMEQMRLVLKDAMQAYSDHQAEMELQDDLLRKAAESLEFTASQETLDEAVQQQMRNLEGQLAQQGLTLDMYCSFMQTDPNKLAQDAIPSAQAALRQQAAVEKIVELEGITAQPEELESAIEGVCRQNNMSREELEPYMDEGFRKAIENSVLTGKVLHLIRDAAVITEV